MINNSIFRRQMFSTSTLQELLIRCCCEPEETADLAVSVSINSDDDGVSIAILESLITVTNHGPLVAENVDLLSSLSAIDTILNAFRFETTHGAWTNTQFSGGSAEAQFTASIGNLAAGEVATLSFTTEVEGQNPRLTHGVEVSSSTRDPDTTNNNASVTFPGASPGGPNVI